MLFDDLKILQVPAISLFLPFYLISSRDSLNEEEEKRPTLLKLEYQMKAIKKSNYKFILLVFVKLKVRKIK